MGLYQYIREQKDRRDPIGELARRLVANPGIQLDHSAEAFRLAAAEFDACGQWTQKEAIERMNANADVWRIIEAEPRVRPVLVAAMHTRTQAEYSRNRTYDALKARLSQFVGYDAEVESVANEASYETLITVISDLLPPDQTDLYPDGLPESVDLDL